MTNIFSSRDSREALELLSEQLAMQVRRKKEEPFFLALSGGETAQQMFRLWTERFSGRIDWDTIRFYWVDERCVPPQDSESNYGHAHELLFGPLNILPAHIHRIRGEEEPAAEAVRYAQEVREELPHRHGIPRFDAIILGAGSDGHTASIFPDSISLMADQNLFAVSAHPGSGQKRITMTGPLILNAAMLLLPIIGKSKAHITPLLLGNAPERELLPDLACTAHFDIYRSRQPSPPTASAGQIVFSSANPAALFLYFYMIAVIFTAIILNFGIMEIQRPGYLLREWRATDCTSLARYANNINIWRNVRDRFPHPYTEEDGRFFIGNIVPQSPGYEFAIVIDGEAAGGIGLVRQSDVERLSAEIGYWIGEPHWNRGIAGDAVGSICEDAFRETELIRLFASVFEYNAPSMRVLEKNGFRKVGVQRRAAIKEGRIIDLHLYERVK